MHIGYERCSQGAVPPDISGQLRRLIIRICIHFVSVQKSSFLFASSENGCLTEVRKKVGQVGQLPIFIDFLHVLNLANLTNFELVGSPVGWVESSRRTKSSKQIVGQVDQLPYFMGRFASLKLANLTNFKWRFFLSNAFILIRAISKPSSHQSSPKKLAKLAKFPFL